MVYDLKEAVRHYQKLGFEVTRSRKREGQLSAFLSAGPLRLVLFEGTTPESPFLRFLAESGPGVYSLYVSVKDLPGLARNLAAAGVGRTPGRSVTPASGLLTPRSMKARE